MELLQWGRREQLRRRRGVRRRAGNEGHPVRGKSTLQQVPEEAERCLPRPSRCQGSQEKTDAVWEPVHVVPTRDVLRRRVGARR